MSREGVSAKSGMEIKTLEIIMPRGDFIFRHDNVFDGSPDIQSGTS